MAKTENGQESGTQDHSLTATLLVNENPENAEEIIPYGSECDQGPSKCTHTAVAVDYGSIKRSTTSPRIILFKCSSCKQSNSVDPDEKDLLVCMKCCISFCSEHAKHHSETFTNETHVVFCKASGGPVRCLACGVEVPLDNELKQAVHNLEMAYSAITRKQAGLCSRNLARKDVSKTTSISDFHNRNSDFSSSLSITVSSKSSSSSLQPRGLSNLGNTCFFNSVLQCLARTPYLLELLLEMKEPGEKATVMIDNNSKLECSLGKWGNVTEALAVTLMQLTQPGGSSFAPAHLLDALRKKHSQFQGYNQHDAHELLRTLLDCVKTEDAKRYQTHIVTYFGLKNTEEVDEKKRTQARELCKKLADIVNIRPDPIFRGVTVSRNQCTKCAYKSEIPESFLDLSLPVSFLKLPTPSIGRKKNDFYEKPKSKHQKKKEQKAARKKNKMARMKKRFDEGGRNKNFDNSITELKDINESGYSSGKASSPVQNNGNLIASDNSNEVILAEAMNEINATSPNGVNEDNVIVSVKYDSNTNSPSSDTVLGDSIASFHEVDVNSMITGGSTETSDKCNKNEVPEMRFCLVDSVTTLSETTNSLRSSSSEEDKEEDDDGDGEDDNDENDANGSDDESADENLFDASEIKTRKLCPTLLPPSEDEENSILACLREYTKCEILTGNNKVICEKCTKEHEKKTGDKKPVYQTFSKELLIKSPPPVLILHLKRFESKGAFSFRKVEKHIAFPLLLDIGSFCSVSCEKLLYPDQKNIMYSLYGIVEHSGSLNAGHYVACVKVRKQVNENSYRKLFLPEPLCNNCEQVTKEDFDKILNEHKNAERQWYYISDSSVRSISEEDVLRKQAYLLFYERIW